MQMIFISIAVLIAGIDIGLFIGNLRDSRREKTTTNVVLEVNSVDDALLFSYLPQGVELTAPITHIQSEDATICFKNDEGTCVTIELGRGANVDYSGLIFAEPNRLDN